MEKAYEKSLQMIKFLGIKLTKSQYNKLAERFDLLSADTLQYINQKDFNYLMNKLVNPI